MYYLAQKNILILICPVRVIVLVTTDKSSEIKENSEGMNISDLIPSGSQVMTSTHNKSTVVTAPLWRKNGALKFSTFAT